MAITAGIGIVCPLVLRGDPPLHSPVIFLYYIILAILAVFFYRQYRCQARQLNIQSEEAREKSNLLNAALIREEQQLQALQNKIMQYGQLRKTIEELNRTLQAEAVAEHLAGVAFAVIAKRQGACILYLVDRNTQVLRLIMAKKADPHSVIREKQGDIFDMWVLKHATPLLIEDVKKDFRFDSLSVPATVQRQVLCVVSVPLISGSRVIGILRLDNQQPGAYGQADLRLLAMIGDIGAVALENAQLYQRTQDLAIHDELTGLFTKAHFFERLKEEVQRSQRQQSEFCLLMADIDNFKLYNDNFGHTAGDIVLRAISQNIRELAVESNAVAGRFGGEEFVLVLPRTSKGEAIKKAESLRGAVERLIVPLRGKDTRVTISIGVSGFLADARDENELIMRADQAMYKAKNAGRNMVVAA